MTQDEELTTGTTDMPQITDVFSGFLRGVLPPQGLNAFFGQIQEAGNNIAQLHSNMLRSTFDGVQQAVNGVFSTVSSTLSGITQEAPPRNTNNDDE
jgi:phage-related protein